MSVNFPVPNSGFNLESTKFKLDLNQVKKVIDAGDGWQDTDGDGWGNRSVNEWGTSFDSQLNLIGKVQGQKNGGLDFLEKKYLATQFNYDAMEQPRGEWLDKKVNPNPIDPRLAEEADHFVESIFWNETDSQGLTSSAQMGQLRHGLDVNKNGVFDMQDATAVAKLDGNANDLTDTDFEQAALSGTNWSPEQLQTINQVKQLTPGEAVGFARDFARDSLQEFGLDPNMMNDNSLGAPFLQPLPQGLPRFTPPPPASQQIWPFGSGNFFGGGTRGAVNAVNLEPLPGSVQQGGFFVPPPPPQDVRLQQTVQDIQQLLPIQTNVNGAQQIPLMNGVQNVSNAIQTPIQFMQQLQQSFSQLTGLLRSFQQNPLLFNLLSMGGRSTSQNNGVTTSFRTFNNGNIPLMPMGS